MFLDCETHGHWPIWVYDRPWWRLFMKRYFMRCIGCNEVIERTSPVPDGYGGL